MTTGMFITDGRSPIWHSTTVCPYLLKANPGALGVRTITEGATRNRRPCAWCTKNTDRRVSLEPTQERVLAQKARR